MRDLFLKRVRGEIPEFHRVVIETTGLADPAPVLHTLMNDPLIAARFRLDGVVTTVDAVNGADQLEPPRRERQAGRRRRPHRADQDRYRVAQAIEDLEGRLKALNPAAPVLRAVQGRDRSRRVCSTRASTIRRPKPGCRTLAEGGGLWDDEHGASSSRAS